MKYQFVWDIPCFFSDPGYLNSIEDTLTRIFKQNPSDFRRLQKMVRAIIPFEVPEEGTLGQYFPAFPNSEDQETWDYGLDDTPCIIMLNGNLSKDRIPGVLAHELGHAATTEADRLRRGQTCNEWRSELAADWYAYKWGFGREIAQQRKTRDWIHHGPVPGSVYEEIGIDGKTYTIKVTRNFVAHILDIREGDLLESIVGGSENGL